MKRKVKPCAYTTFFITIAPLGISLGAFFLPRRAAPPPATAQSEKIGSFIDKIDKFSEKPLTIPDKPLFL